MSAPNLFLTYVSDAKRSTAFYSDLFDIWTGQRGHHPRHAPHERDRTHGPPVVRGGR